MNKTLRVNLAADPDSTDAALMQHVVSAQFLYPTQAKLLNYPDVPGPDGRNVQPEVAVDFPKVSDDGRKYTFKVRTGSDAYKFSTGEEVTAEHFAYAFNRCLQPSMSSPAIFFMHDLAGAQAVASGEAETAEGVRVKSGDTLEIELTEPAPDFLHRIAMPYFGAAPTDLPADPAAVTAPPSAGPYHIAERELGRGFTLRRNPHYQHDRPRFLDAIEFRSGIEPEAGLAMIEKGEADYVADGIPNTHEARLAAKYRINEGQFMISPALQNDYLALNTRREIFCDPFVRRAVAYAVDRPAMLRARGAHAGLVATHLLPPGMPGYRDQHIFPATGPDYERARKELPKGFQGGEAVVYTWDTLAGPEIGGIIAENLKEIGIDCRVVELPEPEMNVRAGRPDEPFDLIATGWTAEYPDPYVFMNSLLDGSSIRREFNSNLSYFSDPSYNARLQAAKRMPAPQRYDVYGDLDVEIMLNAAPLIACDYRTKRDIVSTRVRGAFQHAMYGVDLAALRVDES